VNTAFEEIGTDLEALMARVREAASGGAGEQTSLAQITRDAAGDHHPDLVQVIAAQGEWNDCTTKSLASIVDCLRGLRDEWAHVESRLRAEIARVSALVEDMRTTAAPAAARARGLAVPPEEGQLRADKSTPSGRPRMRRAANGRPGRTRARQTIKRGRRKP